MNDGEGNWVTQMPNELAGLIAWTVPLENLETDPLQVDAGGGRVKTCT